MPEAVLRYEDKEIALPTEVGSEGEIAIDIGRLRAETGLITVDRGFANTAETRSAVSYIDGEKGILRYRGYPIEQIADQCSFLEVAYLLQYGELPTKDELEAYEESITRHTLLREDMKHLFEAFPHDAHPMQILASATSALATYYPDALDPRDEEAIDISSRRLIAKTPTMVAWSYKYRMGQPYVYPRNDLDYSSRFLHMMFSVPSEEYLPDETIARALNVLLILHADHGQNCSSSAVRLVGSGQANIFSSVAAGIHALAGPLHGGANQAVLEMLEGIVSSGGDVSKTVARAKDKNDPFRLMGFGHRVYKNLIPGPAHQKIAEDVSSSAAKIRSSTWRWAGAVALSDDYFVERRLPQRRLLLGDHLPGDGLPHGHVHRSLRHRAPPGWLAQWRELASDPKTMIFRPRQVYVGANARDVVPIDQRR